MTVLRIQAAEPEDHLLGPQSPTLAGSQKEPPSRPHLRATNDRWSGPLAQRLALYGFAQVFADPQTCHPERWGVRGLTRAGGGPSGFQHMLASLPPAIALQQNPIVSGSLQTLTRWRRRQPHRPLVLLRTLYDPPPHHHALEALVFRAHALSPLFWHHDRLEPLYFAAETATQDQLCQSFFQAYCGSRHPRALLFNLLRQHHKDLDFHVGDGGEIYAQMTLQHLLKRPYEHRQWQLETSKPLQFNLRQYDAFWRRQLYAHRGQAYVFAHSRAMLRWFAMDIVRLAPARLQCYHFPNLPDPKDPLPALILIGDRQLRFLRLPRILPLWHLDGQARQMAFRTYRMGSPGQPRWQTESQPKGWARWVRAGRCWLFHLTHRGWQSALKPLGREPCLQQKFSQDLAAQAALWQRDPAQASPDVLTQKTQLSG